jgi:hypothetical protein
MTSTRRTGPRRTLTTLVGLLLIAVAAAAIFASIGGRAAATSAAARGPLNSVSAAAQTPVALLPADTRALQRFSGQGLSSVSLLATRGGRSYYRIESSAGPACYGAGPVVHTSYVLGQIQCAADFPSAARPLLDFTVVHGGTANRASDRVWRSEGIAADGVADVAFLTPSGELVGVSPVVRNVYSLQSLPAGKVSALVARDAQRSVLQAIPVSR